MKIRHFLTAAAMMLSIAAVAQPQPPMPRPDEKEGEGFKFDTIKVLPITSIKDQNQAGTCWCYSSLAFFESELLRMGKPEYDFSEMYIVYKTYLDRAEAAVRTHGDVSFSQGGAFGDVLYAIRHYGLVPDELMPAGAMHGDSLSNFSELSAVTDPFVEGVIKSRKIQMDKDGNPLWKKALAGIYDAYLGVPPTEFTYKGKKYTPMSFAESTGLNFSANPLFFLLAPHIRDALPKVFQVERPRDVPGHDAMDDCRGQHPQPHGLGHGGLVLADGPSQLADVSELTLVDVLLPAERPRQAERERYGFIGDGAGDNNFLSGRYCSEHERDGNLQTTVFKNLADHCMPPEWI